MAEILYILLFLISCVGFYFAGKWVIKGLSRLARFLGWREFVVAFVVMASAASLPNLVVGISSALRGIPQLSLGDVTGNNLAALTLAMAIAVIFAGGTIPAESKMVKKTSIFVMVSALLPMILILDNNLSRLDGVALIIFFLVYVSWLFSKSERFTKVYKTKKEKPTLAFKHFLKDLILVLCGLVLFIIASQGVVISAKYFAFQFDMSIVLIGILITGLGSALPEIYFDFISARKGETWMILGDLMGAVIIPSTLVLGIVALINPIYVIDFSSLAIARIFIVIAALFFPLFVNTGKGVSRKEGVILLFIYVTFLIIEIFFR